MVARMLKMMALMAFMTLIIPKTYAQLLTIAPEDNDYIRQVIDGGMILHNGVFVSNDDYFVFYKGKMKDFFPPQPSMAPQKQNKITAAGFSLLAAPLAVETDGFEGKIFFAERAYPFNGYSIFESNFLNGIETTIIKAISSERSDLIGLSLDKNPDLSNGNEVITYGVQTYNLSGNTTRIDIIRNGLTIATRNNVVSAGEAAVLSNKDGEIIFYYADQINKELIVERINSNGSNIGLNLVLPTTNCEFEDGITTCDVSNFHGIAVDSLGRWYYVYTYGQTKFDNNKGEETLNTLKTEVYQCRANCTGFNKTLLFEIKNQPLFNGSRTLVTNMAGDKFAYKTFEIDNGGKGLVTFLRETSTSRAEGSDSVGIFTAPQVAVNFFNSEHIDKDSPDPLTIKYDDIYKYINSFNYSFNDELYYIYEKYTRSSTFRDIETTIDGEEFIIEFTAPQGVFKKYNTTNNVEARIPFGGFEINGKVSSKKANLIRVAHSTFAPPEVELVNLTANKQAVVEVNMNGNEGDFPLYVVIEIEAKMFVNGLERVVATVEDKISRSILFSEIGKEDGKLIQMTLPSEPSNNSNLFGTVMTITAFAYKTNGQRTEIDSINATVFDIPPQDVYTFVIDHCDAPAAENGEDSCYPGDLTENDVSRLLGQFQYAENLLPTQKINLNYDSFRTDVNGHVIGTSTKGESSVDQYRGIDLDFVNLYLSYQKNILNNDSIIKQPKLFVLGLVNNRYSTFHDIRTSTGELINFIGASPIGDFRNSCERLSRDHTSNSIIITTEALEFPYQTTLAHEIMHNLGFLHTPKDYIPDLSSENSVDASGLILNRDPLLKRVDNPVDIMTVGRDRDRPSWIPFDAYNLLTCRLASHKVDPPLVNFVGLLNKDGSFENVSTIMLPEGFIDTSNDLGEYELRAVDHLGQIISSYKYSPSFRLALIRGDDDDYGQDEEVETQYFPIMTNIEVNDNVVEIQALKNGILIQTFPPETNPQRLTYAEYIDLIPNNAFRGKNSKKKALFVASKIDQYLEDKNIKKSLKSLYRLKYLIIRHLNDEYPLSGASLSKKDLLSLILSDIEELKENSPHHDKKCFKKKGKKRFTHSK